MLQWLADKEVNTGRQREFDYLKGIFMILIFIIHAFQGTSTPEDAPARAVYIFNSISGAAIFIFVMGFGTAYSRNNAPATYVKNGVRLIFYQYLSNLSYAAMLWLPWPFIAARVSAEGVQTLHTNTGLLLQYTNIFFISGVIYLVLALLRKLKAPLAVWVALGVAVSLAAPHLYGVPVNVPVLGYVAQLLIGEAPHVSFTPLYFLPYALLGAAFGKLYRRVRDKRAFYRQIVPVCLVIAAVWWFTFLQKTGMDIQQIRRQASLEYTHPDLWHAVASIAHILLMAALLWFVGMRSEGEAKNPLSRQLLYYSKHISKYYALHALTYFFIWSLHGYTGFESRVCWLLVLVCMLTTEAMVQGYNAVYERMRKNG